MAVVQEGQGKEGRDEEAKGSGQETQETGSRADCLMEAFEKFNVAADLKASDSMEAARHQVFGITPSSESGSGALAAAYEPFLSQFEEVESCSQGELDQETGSEEN